MPLEQLWLFTTITLVLSASPGPVMLACMIDAGRYGFAKSLYTMLGASVGNFDASRPPADAGRAVRQLQPETLYNYEAGVRLRQLFLEVEHTY